MERYDINDESSKTPGRAVTNTLNKWQAAAETFLFTVNTVWFLDHLVSIMISFLIKLFEFYLYFFTLGNIVLIKSKFKLFCVFK